MLGAISTLACKLTTANLQLFLCLEKLKFYHVYCLTNVLFLWVDQRVLGIVYIYRMSGNIGEVFKVLAHR